MEHNDLLDRIKTWVRYFKCNYNVQRYEESKNLNDYLHFRIVRKEYEAKVAALAVSFKNFHRNHVDIELKTFDKAKKVRQLKGGDIEPVPIVPNFQKMTSKQLQCWSLGP